MNDTIAEGRHKIMSQYKGRLTYAKGTYVEFVVAPNQEVDFGDI